jgi:hypothetical protein
MLLSSFLFLLGCPVAPEDTGDTDGLGVGWLALSFEIDPDQQDRMDEDPVGVFTGSFYLATDVTSLGPNEGAVPVGAILVEEVDLAEGSTGVLFTSEDLPAEAIVVLGFLDSDDNRDPLDADPDSKDPVTLPGQNTFLVEAGSTSEARVHFGFLNP